MILTAHQPVYLPWCGLFHKISLADKYVVFDCVQFERKGYSNRVRIKTKDGAQWLTVPIDHGAPLLIDAMISESGWARKHVKTIEFAYKDAPYFEDYFNPLAEILTRPWRWLADLDDCLLAYLFKFLEMPQPPTEYAVDLALEGQKSALVLDMCRKMGATQYIFGANGRDYADVAAFGREGILVQFQDYKHPVYPQLHGEFISGLSVIDLLFNCGPESSKVLKDGNAAH